jgi:cephalosporin-C deacetylase
MCGLFFSCLLHFIHIDTISGDICLIYQFEKDIVMAVVDMPLAELKQYNGSSPKPADFDGFWDKSLEEMRSVDADVKLVRAGFNVSFADCFDMYFTGVGGARIYTKLVRPKKHEGKCPGLLQFHGYSGSSGEWCSMLGYAAEGFVVAAMDCRGQGGLSEDAGGVKGTTLHGHIIRGLDDKPEKLLYRHIYLDTAQLAKIIMDMEEVDANRVGAMGGSQGGGLTVACAGLEPRIKRLAPVFPFLSDYKRVWDLDLGTAAYIELKDFFRRHDPRHEREDEIFTRLGYIDVQNLADRIKGEVLMGVSFRDDICPPSTQFAVYNKIQSAKKMLLYPDFGHENLPGLSDKNFEFLCQLKG